MAIKIKTSFAMIILFWVGIIFTPLSLWLIYENSTQFPNIQTSSYGLIFGLICNITSIYYYKKVGWSELGWESAGCFVSILFLIILIEIYEYFFN